MQQTNDWSSVLAVSRRLLTVRELANVVGVRERQVHHWLTGTHKPQGHSRERLLDAALLVRTLLRGFSEEGAEIWLRNRHPRLMNQRPIDVIQHADAGFDLSDVIEVARGEVEDEAARDPNMIASVDSPVPDASRPSPGWADRVAAAVPLIERFVKAAERDPEMVDDITMDVIDRLLVRARTGIFETMEEDHFRAYVRTVVRYASADAYRKRSRRVATEPLRREFEPFEDDPALLAITETNPYLESRLAELVRGLPDRYSNALLWSIAGADSDEIAQKLGTTPEAARAVMSRARKMLRARLEELEDAKPGEQE